MGPVASFYLPIFKGDFASSVWQDITIPWTPSGYSYLSPFLSIRLPASVGLSCHGRRWRSASWFQGGLWRLLPLRDPLFLVVFFFLYRLGALRFAPANPRYLFTVTWQQICLRLPPSPPLPPSFGNYFGISPPGACEPFNPNNLSSPAYGGKQDPPRPSAFFFVPWPNDLCSVFPLEFHQQGPFRPRSFVLIATVKVKKGDVFFEIWDFLTFFPLARLFVRPLVFFLPF